MKKILYWIPVILWMLVIFYSSSQTYQEQDIRPWLNDVLPEQFITKHFSNVKIIYDGKEISIATKGVATFVEFIIRKAAHIGAFAILSILLLFAIIRTSSLKKWQVVIITILGSFLYACSDELHQMYTGDRIPKFADVVIDTVGAGIGVVLFLAVTLLRKRTV